MPSSLALLAFGEDLCAGPGDEDGVLELRRQAAVRRHGRPAVLPHVALDAVASHGQDRLCPELRTASVKSNSNLDASAFGNIF